MFLHIFDICYCLIPSLAIPRNSVHNMFQYCVDIGVDRKKGTQIHTRINIRSYLFGLIS